MLTLLLALLCLLLIPAILFLLDSTISCVSLRATLIWLLLALDRRMLSLLLRRVGPRALGSLLLTVRVIGLIVWLSGLLLELSEILLLLLWHLRLTATLLLFPLFLRTKPLCVPRWLLRRRRVHGIVRYLREVVVGEAILLAICPPRS